MKRILLFVVIAAFSLPGATEVWAQASDFYVRINGTAGFPLSPEQFRERYESAFGGGVTIGYLLFTGLELTADISLQRYLAEEDPVTAARFQDFADGEGPFLGGDAMFVTGMLGGRFHLTSDSPISGHLLLEGGFQRVSTTTATSEEDGVPTRTPGMDETSPLVAAGVGTTIALTRSVGVYAQISYNIAFAEERVHYAPLKAGLIFRLGNTDW